MESWNTERDEYESAVPAVPPEDRRHLIGRPSRSEAQEA
jgi:hypothetical protein